MTDISHLSTDNRKLPDTYGEFVNALKKPGEAIRSSLTAFSADLLHMAVGLSGEVAELQEPFLAVRGTYHLIDRANIIEELGDIEFYTEGLYLAIGLEREVEWFSPVYFDQDREELLLSLVTHAGKILDDAKRVAIYGKELDVEQIVEHLNSFEGELEALYQTLNVDREEVINHNVSKLSTRYSTLSYSDKQAQERADKA